ncbi:MAG: ATP-binding protein [Bacteroidales bacterium]|nr:ATP-binding protein [Bacteroidales bacterium]
MFYTSLHIESDLDNIVIVENFIDSLMEDFSISENYKGILSVPLLEAVHNAIIHGNQSDKSKKVSSNCQIMHKQITFSVSDEGDGFDYKYILAEALENRKTSGLSSIELLCDEMEFINQGATIIFSMQIPLQMPQEREIAVLSEKEHKQVVKKAW